MKLRIDLLEQLQDEDVLKAVQANGHRYKPEPSFSKTGVGSLSTASAFFKSVDTRWCSIAIWRQSMASPPEP